MFSCQSDNTKHQEEHSTKKEVSSVAKMTVLKDSLILKNTEGLVYFKDKPFSGISMSYYPNEINKTSLEYLEGIRHGYYRKWFSNGVLSFESSYENGKKDGVSKSWWINGNLRSESNFENGEGQGVQLQYYKSGAKFKKIHLVDGKENGIQQSWRENGKLYNNYEAKNGRIFGLKRANLCFSLDNEEVVLDSKK